MNALAPETILSQFETALLQRAEDEQFERLQSASKKTLAATTCAFLNSHGGQILVVPTKADPGELQSYLLSAITPRPTCSVTAGQIGGQDALLVEVPAGADGPYGFDGRIFLRRGGDSVAAAPREVVELVNRLEKRPRWENEVCPGCEIEDLDAEQLAQTTNSAHNRRFAEFSAEPSELLGQLNLLSSGAITNAAATLFAPQCDRFLPQTRVKIAAFENESRNAFQTRVLSGHFFSILDQILTFLGASLPIHAAIPSAGWERTELASYPMPVVREAIVNALVHRDYAAFDGNVTISLFPTRMEIWNPGRLMDGLQISDIQRGAVSRTRNPDLAHILFLRGLVERFGSGGPRMVEGCRAAGLPAPIWSEVGGGILLTLRTQAHKSKRDAATLNARILKFLRSLEAGQTFSARDYQKGAAADISDRRARTDLAQMLEAQLVTREGSGPSTLYRRTQTPLS